MEVSLQSFRTRFSYDSQKDLLGKGGFGEVYKAYDNEDHIYVALKLRQSTTDDKYNLISEFKRFKKLNHPNIVNHIEAYEVNTGSTDIHGKSILYHVGILEYADKGTLADLLKNPKDFGSFGNFRNLIEDLANDIIDGLAYLHSLNIIHRDLKPTNILLFSVGEKLRAKITDFGIAKQADATAASTQLVGTVEYMAPEYFTTGNITKASDIWSLGVMLLEALSGTHPFGKTTQGLSNEQIIRNILSKDLQENLANAPLKELLNRCLLREANLRPQSAEEIKGDLLINEESSFEERTQLLNKYIPQKQGKSLFAQAFAALFFMNFQGVNRTNLINREIVLLSLVIILALFIRLSINYTADYQESQNQSYLDKMDSHLEQIGVEGTLRNQFKDSYLDQKPYPNSKQFKHINFSENIPLFDYHDNIIGYDKEYPFLYKILLPLLIVFYPLRFIIAGLLPAKTKLYIGNLAEGFSEFNFRRQIDAGVKTIKDWFNENEHVLFNIIYTILIVGITLILYYGAIFIISLFYFNGGKIGKGITFLILFVGMLYALLSRFGFFNRD